jgi:iron complex outermembrane receptor protein
MSWKLDLMSRNSSWTLRCRAAALTLASVGLTLGRPALAAPGADGSARAAEAESTTRIEELVVTGRRRSEPLRSVPISMLALPERELAARSLDSLLDLGRGVANLKLDATTGSQHQIRAYIRGVGQDSASPRVDPGVGIYLDGVYLPRAQGSLLQLFDVERVEVLRGPQGTLYGKNTVGGVVHVITRRPQSDFAGSGQVAAGSDGLLRTRLMLNAPLGSGALGERAMARVALATGTSDGYQRDRVGGGRVGDDKLLAARIGLRLLPTERVELNLSVDRSTEHEEEFAAKCRLGSRLTLGAFAVDNFVADPTFVDACNESAAASELEVFPEDLGDVEQDILGTAATLDWDLGALRLRSITSWRRRESQSSGGDTDGTRARFTREGAAKDEHDAWSQELQLQGSALDERLEFVLGIYGFEEEGHDRSEGDVLRDLIRDPATPLRGDVSQDPLAIGLAAAGIDVRTFDGVDRAAAVLLGSDAPLRMRLSGLNNRNTSRFEARSHAAFGDLSFAPSERIRLSAGLRYTRERKEREGTRSPVFPELGGSARAGVPIAARFDRWTPRLAASLQLGPELFAYASYARGFKSGGFNETVVRSADLASVAPFRSEDLDGYEIGLKSAWLDRRLVVNLAAFASRYSEIQLANLEIGQGGTLTTSIRNGGKADLRGLELEVQTRPFAGLTLEAGVGVISASYARFRDRQAQPPSNPAGCASTLLAECGAAGVSMLLRDLLNPTFQPVDKSDLDFKHTPPLSFNLLGRYELDTARAGRISLQASWVHQGRIFFDVDNQIEQNKYGLLSLRAALALPDGRTSLALWMNNALDRRYLQGAVDAQDVASADFLFFGPPRSWGVEIRRSF